MKTRSINKILKRKTKVEISLNFTFHCKHRCQLAEVSFPLRNKKIEDNSPEQKATV